MRHLPVSGLLLLLTGATPAPAQSTFSLGPQVGLNVSSFSLPAGSNVTVSRRAGLLAGVQAVAQFGHLAVQPALHFSQLGAHEQYQANRYSDATDYRLNYLTLPVQVSYSLRPTGQGVQVFAGGYAGLLLGGSYRRVVVDSGIWGSTATYEGDIRPGTRGAYGTVGHYEYCRPFDLGVQAGVGYRLHRFLAQASFRVGLPDLAPLLSPFSNRAAQASLSYLFAPGH